ncbi:hypothetical protein ABH945_002374 [Paraburkholderia sp. GAS333]|uniref:hypothetical protein n=1 Tax=Paraburkholderia sp. GAS333 TaxID=3156279 RepID=UPI003D193999
MGDGAAGKSLIVPASCRCLPLVVVAQKQRLHRSIFALNVKIGQGLQSVTVSIFCFRYNGGHVQVTVLPQGDASPSQMGARIATQVWAVAFVDGHQVSKLFDAHVLPSQAPRACNGLNP